MASNVYSELRALFPQIYDEVLEIDELSKGHAEILDEAFDMVDTIWKDQAIPTADSDGLERFEQLFGIVASPSETLAFRRERLINRFSLSPPFTIRFLKQQLDILLGVGNWRYTLDYGTQTLRVYSSVSSSGWAHEIAVTISQLKPANLVFISSPLVSNDIKVSEQIEKNTAHYHYKLGTQWLLGQKPFVSREITEVVKLATVPSIQDPLLDGLAESVASQVSSVLINNTYTITTFSTKSATDNETTIEYTVPTSSGLDAITSIELLNSDDEVLSSLTVYVLLADDVILTHKIKVEEGV